MITLLTPWCMSDHYVRLNEERTYMCYCDHYLHTFATDNTTYTMLYVGSLCQIYC
jgi:hypothetical protein